MKLSNRSIVCGLFIDVKRFINGLDKKMVTTKKGNATLKLLILDIRPIIRVKHICGKRMFIK